MKKVKYDDLLSIDKIINTYKRIIKNTKHKEKIFTYNMFYTTNILNIYNVLKDKNYVHGRYNIFIIKKPKLRLIMSENLSDKIVNHLVSYLILPIIEPKLIDTNVATRINKGTKEAIHYMKKYLIKMKRKYNYFYILKCDIKKYFYNIDHEILYDKLKITIYDKDILELLKSIIDSTDCEYVNETIKKLNKDVPIYNKGKGLPIGNMSSQLFAIFYLNELDHFIKEKLRIKYYIRYMDDFILIHKDKEYLKYCKLEIERFLKQEKLELNKKTNIHKINNGFVFLGYKYKFKNNKLLILMTSNNKVKARKNVKNYNGYLKYVNCNKFKMIYK